MASCAFSHRRFSRRFGIRQWMMTEGKESPAIRLSKPLIVLHGNVNSVVLTIEISASGWFCTRPVWKSWIKNASQFFDNDRSLRELAILQICLDVLLLNVDMMIFREVRLPVVEAIGC